MNPIFRPLILLLLILLFRELALLALISWDSIGLSPDEAQYWTWSQRLDWGYYSKPPGIAWQIWLGTKFFGNTELGVRFISGILAILLSLATYFLARSAKLSPWNSFWAALVLSLSPLGVLGVLFAITDGGMLLFWTLAAILIVAAVAADKTPNYYIVGLAILCGALFKWPIYLFWSLLLLSMPFYKNLRSWHLVGGILVSLLGLLPSIIWNASHQWVTFRHVWATISGTATVGDVLPATGNPLGFLSSQAGLISPIAFGLLILAFFKLLRHPSEFTASMRLCGAWSLFLLSACFALSFFQKIQGNWCVIAYPTAFPFLTAYAYSMVKQGKTWLIATATLSSLLCVLLLSIPTIQKHDLLHPVQIPYKYNLFRHNVGWENLHQLLKKIDDNPQNHVLFGDTYQASSLLSFYGPEQTHAYFLNLRSVRKNQFSFWPSLAEERPGGSGYFVSIENLSSDSPEWESKIYFYRNKLPLYFRGVHELGTYPLFISNGKEVKSAVIFSCEGYNGLIPVEPDRY